MIFCVEDDHAICDLMIYALQSAGFEAKSIPDGSSLFSILEKEAPELIMLDIMLPGEDGITILKKLRNNTSTADIPVIMATAKGTDYLTKPFGMMEMISRVKAVLRRSRPKENVYLLRAGHLEINTGEHIVSVNGERIFLTLKEYELLRLFMDNPGKAFTREQLLRHVWGADYMGETRTVDVHIGTMRSKLGSCGDYIETVRGVGFRMEAKDTLIL